MFEIVPGDPRSRVVIHVPHASRTIPADVRAGIYLDDAALERELDAVTDAFTGVIAEHVAAHAPVRPWLFVNRLSRLVVDPGHFPDEHEELNAAGVAAVRTRTSDGFVLRDPSDDEISGLVVRWLAPYANAMSNLVAERLSATGGVTLIDLHSYPLVPQPYELHDRPRPEVRLGTDTIHSPDWLVLDARKAFGQFEASLDSPFAGCFMPLGQRRGDERVNALRVGVHRDLYMDVTSKLVEPALEPIVRALVSLLDLVEPGDCT
ncbi:N-formylglutamate amidohydrolase [Aeromicrobium sp. S22]|uniref:N-formylglutamate amidohydrolase n=1 Tax=Aeromicrobium sp. S22 TaxID=2662029 RepID=UPI00129EF5D8|nr:N-formylglutamate amidohydrolase [Aeromicrobium sp. S22]MRK01391.1 N-formylglutamate amidohydrolase [Aeromicrobium sp. S22]